MKSKVSLLIIVAFFISSCGFHLRGTLEVPPSLQSIRLQSNASPDWTRAVKSSLTNAGVAFADTAEVTLILNKTKESRRVASYNKNAKAAEYQLRSELIFSAENKQGELLIPKRTLVSERIYRYNETQIAGKTEEEALLKLEMQQDLIRQLVQQFRLAASTTTQSSSRPSSNTQIKTLSP